MWVKIEVVNKVKPKYSEVLKEFRDKTKWPQGKIAKAIGVRRATS
jgi:DNA-binding XRE family transcriptional regulator